MWVSEIMLQQTRIETVKPYYERFLRDYPTVHSLAQAPEDQVLKHWEGLGYYSRARNLQKAARQIDEKGEFPSTWEQIRALPGIGDYTAGAIAAIAFGQKVLAVDGNVLRVVSRLYGLTDNVLDPESRGHVTRLLEEVYPEKASPGDFVQGLMELGETVCTPKAPLCLGCPLAPFCTAFLEKRQDELPVRIARNARRREQLAVLICRDPSGNLLVCQRPKGTVLAGLYELLNVPEEEKTGKGAGADAKELEKAIQEKYGAAVRIRNYLGTVRHVFTHITWDMDVYAARGSLPAQGVSDLSMGKKVRAVSEEQREKELMLPTAFRKVLEKEKKADPGKDT